MDMYLFAHAGAICRDMRTFADAHLNSDPFKDFVEENGMDKKHKDYPHKRRFCAIVDCRKEEDELTFFEPPENCCSFPEHKESYVQLWYFDASRTCILPKGQNKDKAFTSSSTNAMTLSFHVESVDEIRCYLHVNGGMMRFLPQDITGVLPKFFDLKFENNSQWATCERAKELVQAMTPQLKDVKFNAFYDSCF